MEQIITMPCQTETSQWNAKHGHPMPKSILGKLLLCIKELFKLLVWQVCPPHIPTIIRKLLFGQRKASYSFVLKPGSTKDYDMKFREGCESLVTEDKKIPTWLSNIDCNYIYPEHTERLATRYVKSRLTPKTAVVLFCHANGVDLGFDINIHYYMSWRVNCDVFTFDYSGYGQSTGVACEKNMYKDVMAAYNYLINTKNVDPNDIVAYGQSLGTAAAIEIASKVKLKGLILDGLFLSAYRILWPKLKKRLPMDQLDSYSKISNIQCPTLVIHGAMDPLTNFQNAEVFFKLCETLVPPLIIPTGMHLDLMNYRAYWNRLEVFFNKEINFGWHMENYGYCNPFCSENHKIKPSDDPLHTKLNYPFHNSETCRTNLYN